MERLQKYLARAGIASRRHAEQLISDGHITVNNRKVTELGTKVEPGKDLVAVDGKLVAFEEKRAYYILYKPPGVVTTLSDPQGRPTVKDLVPVHVRQRLFPVGRLDYDAEGALILTDDGELANRLTHPKYNVARTYLAKVKGVPSEATLEKLRGGVRLEDGPAKPLSVNVFENAEKNTWITLVVGEGRPHLIKRLCAAVGHPVVRLFRPFQASIGVEGIRPGQLRALTGDEVRRVHEVSEGKAFSPPMLRLPARRHGRTGAGASVTDERELATEDGDDMERRPRKQQPWQGAPASPKAPAELGRNNRPGRLARTDRFGAERGAPAPAKPRGRTPARVAAEDRAGGGLRSSSGRPASRGGRPAWGPALGHAPSGPEAPAGTARQQGRFERSETKKTFSRTKAAPTSSGPAPARPSPATSNSPWKSKRAAEAPAKRGPGGSSAAPRARKPSSTVRGPPRGKPRR